MQANRGRDTTPEIAVRRILHARGLRYRVHYPVPGHARRRIDIAFPGKRVACFIDGCFWHGCEEHFVSPRSHEDFWSAKIAGNRQRDANTDAILEGSGWQVARYWEHELPAEIAMSIELRIAGQS